MSGLFSGFSDPTRPSCGVLLLDAQRGEAGRHLKGSKDKFSQGARCNVHLSPDEYNQSEYVEITVKNMFFPAIFFASCAALGMMLHIIHKNKRFFGGINRSMGSLIGRLSSLNLVEEVEPSEEQPRRVVLASSVRSSLSTLKTSIVRRITFTDEDDANCYDEETQQRPRPVRRAATEQTMTSWNRAKNDRGDVCDAGTERTTLALSLREDTSDPSSEGTVSRRDSSRRVAFDDKVGGRSESERLFESGCAYSLGRSGRASRRHVSFDDDSK